uniref:CHAT domain-containing protein n=1 Tax=Pseudictyota dubia TaxID=2749911 RepID=A0A7R9ZCI5_9STRA|mmetsp:Transcript_40066/g.74021  ORF Transcript_40066/g.74021 Transcript_40066/m.74021 type:complete len:1133 (+) Transcript_40066:516-3914(+)
MKRRFCTSLVMVYQNFWVSMFVFLLSSGGNWLLPGEWLIVPFFFCCAAIEDGSGGAQFLRDDDLREFMRAGNGELLFVFVSACYSRSAGEAFLEAGVPHVVCCQHDEPLMDLAAQEFSRSFYLSLACGKTLKQSFEMAKQAVKLCPQIPNAADEVRKFLLLPEDGDHDVPIFFTKPRTSSFGRKPSLLPSPWMLPAPPEVFVGREMDMYRIIQNLGRSRLVRITGCPGSGKASVAAAVARYISVRERTFTHFDEVIWLPLIYTTRTDTLSPCFYELFAMLQDEGLAMSLQHNAKYQQVVGQIFESLCQAKVLLVIETKAFLEIQSMNKLSIFLHDLFRGTKNVRVLLICQQGFEISLHNSVVESEVVVEPLDFEATATLFGRLCPFVSDHRYSRACTPRQLSGILVPKEKADVKLFSQQNTLSKRCVDIFKMIGGGVPSRIHLTAREMTPEEYDRLISIGEQLEYNSDCKTRVELEVQLDRLGEDVQVAVREKNFKKAREIQSALDELEMQREALPEIEELRTLAAELNKDLTNAISQKDFVEAENLNHQLELLNGKITVEQEALVLFDKDAKPSGKNGNSSSPKESDYNLFATRAGLECEIRKLQHDLDSAVQERDFSSCRRIQAEIDELIERRKSLPSREELTLKITSLKAELDTAVTARNFVKAESVHCEINEIEDKIALERESEDDFVASTAVKLGKRLVELGDALQKAVTNHEDARAKDLETSIMKEIKCLEEQFTLRYSQLSVPEADTCVDDSPPRPKSDDDQLVSDLFHESIGAARAPGMKSHSSPESTFESLLPKPERRAKRSSTIAQIPSSSAPFEKSGGDSGPGRGSGMKANPTSSSAPLSMGGEHRPGAVAVPGISEVREERTSVPTGHLPGHSPREREEIENVEGPSRNQAHTQGSDHSDKRSVARRTQERFEQGLCPTCSSADDPTQCFIFKKSGTDATVRTRIPLTIEGLVHEGKCLICDPEASQRTERVSTAVMAQGPSSNQSNPPSLEPMTSSAAPASQPSERNGISSGSPGLENVDVITPDIAVATRVDAVAQEDAIERIVRDTIRRVAEGTQDINESSGITSAAVGRILSYEQSDNNSRASRDTDDAIQHTSERDPKAKKKSFMKSVLKFGKKK